MRCPKCGYISFDHLAACSSCSRDLTAIALELHGTSIESDLSLFLGSVIGEEPTEAELQFSEQDAMTGQADELIFGSDLTTDDQEITIQLDEPQTTPELEEEALTLNLEPQPELTLDMDEIPALDLSQIEGEASADEVQSDQTAMLFAEAGEFQEGQGEKLTLNLDEIDLSDLAPLDEEDHTAAVAPQSEPEPETEPEITLDLGMDADTDSGATLDLGSAMAEENETPILDLEDFMLGTGLENTTETLELQDLLSNNIADNEGAAQASKAAPKKKSAPAEIKLSLESDD